MTFASHKLVKADFDPLPSINHHVETEILVGTANGSGSSRDDAAIGYVVDDDLGGLDRLSRDGQGADIDAAVLAAAGFQGRAGQTLLLHHLGSPVVVLVGCGSAEQLTEAGLRDAAADFARAASRSSALSLVPPIGHALAPDAVGRAAVEGMLLARYRYTELKTAPDDIQLGSVRVVVPESLAEGTARGTTTARITARACMIARDLTNTPPGHLTAVALASLAGVIAETYGLEAESSDKARLIELGCGGLLGVNAGSTEEPRMIVLRYRPPADGSDGRDGSGAPPHVALVGKGIMYDSGGISLKPSDPMHFSMKMDMAGAAAIVGAMTGLRELGCTRDVTAFLMCTDNMPSGSAMKLGDVLTIRGGTTVEIKNSDAEGRLVMSDALVLASEEHPDAIIDIATLTGAALMSLGTRTAALFGNDDELLDRVREAARRTDEGVWQLPLEHRYRPQLDSQIADMSNMGGKYAGSTTAALFLEEFVAGIPWAHIDMAGTMQSDDDDAWRPRGATGFGARMLLDLLTSDEQDQAATPG